MLLTGSEDLTAQLWDAASGKPIGQPLWHHGRVTAVAFSPDGRVLLTGSEDGAARLWDEASGKPLGQPLQHEDWVTAVAFSPDGHVVLTGSWDGTARLWDAASGKPLGQTLQHQGSVTAVAFSPDGRVVLTGCQDGTARLWDAASGKPIGKPLQHQGSVTTVAFSPDGDFITTTTSDARLHRFQIATGTARDAATLWCYGVSINSPRFLNTTGSRARVWDFVTGNYVWIRDINFDVLQSEPIQGQPADLLREWLDVTALKFPEDGGTLIDKYPPPPLVSPKELDLSREKKQRGSL